MAPMHTKDQDKLLARAEELGWTVVDTDPFTLTKLGRTLRVTVNLGGMITGAEWSGGPERTSLGSGSASVGRLLNWLGTDIEGRAAYLESRKEAGAPPPPDYDEVPPLPETDLQSQSPPPPVVPDHLKETLGEVAAGQSMLPPEVVAEKGPNTEEALQNPQKIDQPAAADVPPAPEPAKKTPAKKAPAKKAAATKEESGAKDSEASSPVPSGG